MLFIGYNSILLKKKKTWLNSQLHKSILIIINMRQTLQRTSIVKTESYYLNPQIANNYDKNSIHKTYQTILKMCV